MVYYLRPRTSLKVGSPKHSPYRFYKASPVASESKTEAVSQASSSPVSSSPASVSPAAASPASESPAAASPASESPAVASQSSDMLKVAVPYLIISVVVSAVVAGVIMAGVKPCEGCCEFLTSKDDKGKVVVNNLKVIGFSLSIGLLVGLLCFGVHSASPSLFDP
jgi:hypothetical protein